MSDEERNGVSDRAGGDHGGAAQPAGGAGAPDTGGTAGQTSPCQTLAAVWCQRRAWADTGAEGKARQELGRRAALELSVGGALLGASSTLTVLEGGSRSLLALSSAIAIAIAGYFGRELLTEGRESAWARARLLAEALKREVWLCLMRVPPYDEDDAASRIERRAGELLANTGLDRAPLPEKIPALPEVNGVDDYIERRVHDQVRYYERAAGRYRRNLAVLRAIAFIVGGSAVAIGVVGAVAPEFTAFVPFATTLSGAIAAWIQASRTASLMSLYQETSTQLILRVALWQDRAHERAGLPEDEVRLREVMLVRGCEDVMARENESWRAEWLDEEKARQALEAIEALRQPSAS